MRMVFGVIAMTAALGVAEAAAQVQGVKLERPLSMRTAQCLGAPGSFARRTDGSSIP